MRRAGRGDEVQVGQTVLRVGLIPPPLDIPGYRPEREIGVGPRGPCFARRESDNIRIAIKTLWSRAGRAKADLFMGRIAGCGPRPPGLTRVLGGGVDRPLLLYAAEYVNGPNVEQIVAGPGHDGPGRVLVSPRPWPAYLTGRAGARAR